MIKLLVDSSSDYTPEETSEKGMILIPVTITLDGRTYTDGIDLKRDEFFRLLTGSNSFPQTAQPSPQSFLKVFGEAKEKGDELICILLSSELSGTVQSALLAKNMADYDKIYIVDSLCATYNIKILADYALSLIEKGVTAPEIVDRINRLKSHVKVVAVPDTLEYLYRGGRISRISATVGELANIKPVITLTPQGTVSVISKSLGKNRAMNYITAKLQEWGVDESFPFYSIYSYGTENCEKYERRLTENGYHVTARLQIGATIGTHIGPGAFGVVFVDRL